MFLLLHIIAFCILLLLLLTELSNTRERLALEEFEAGSSTRRDMAELVFGLVLGDDSGGITTTDDHGRTVLSGLDRGIEQSRGALSECGELKDTRGTSFWSAAASVHSY